MLMVNAEDRGEAFVQCFLRPQVSADAGPLFWEV